MSNTTETRSVPTYSRLGSLTPPATSLNLPTSSPRHICPSLSLPSSLSLPRGPPSTPSHPILFSPALVDSAISLVESRLERLNIHLTKLYPFKAERLRYAPFRYLVEFAQFILDCDASNNTSPNWEAALTILIRKHLIQRKDASPKEVERYRRIVQTLIDTACEPDVAIPLFRDEGIEEDIWARGMSGTTGYGNSISAVGSSGKRAKFPEYFGNLMPERLGSTGSDAPDQVDSDRVRAALADFFDLHRFGIDSWEEVSGDEKVTAYLMESLNIVERIFSFGSSRVAGSSSTALNASGTPDSIKSVSRLVIGQVPLPAGSDVISATNPPTILTSDSEGDHSVQCDATTPPTTPASSSVLSTSRTTSQARPKRSIRPLRKPRTKPTPPERLGLDLEPSTYPTPNLLSRWKPHSPSSILSTPTTSIRINVTPVGGTILQPGSTFAQRKTYAVQFRTHQNRVAEFEHSYYAPFSTLNATLCFMNPEERRRFDKGRTPLERQINSERRREVWGHVVRTVGPAEVRDEEVWWEVSGRLRGMVHSWDEEWKAGHRERFGRKAGLAAGQSGRGGSGGACRLSEDHSKGNDDAWRSEKLVGEVARGGEGKKWMDPWETPGWKRWPPTLASSSDSDDEPSP